MRKIVEYELWLDSLRLTESTKNKLLEEYITAEEIFHEKDQFLEFKIKNKNDLEKLKVCRNRKHLEKYVSRVTELGIQALFINTPQYPSHLKTIADPPRLLYLKGKASLLESPTTVGIVGSRKITDYGRYVCHDVVRELARKGLTIISGLAIGTDALAHKVCLTEHGDTIAVLGSGIDNLYPKRNYQLAEEIIQKGLIVSEFPLGTPPLPHHFPRRNRIISGLSKAVIVIEAKEKSGSLITARLAAEQGKEVFSVPGNITSIFSRGTNLLIADGAIPLLEVNQVLEMFPELDLKESVKHIDWSKFSEKEILLIKELQSQNLTLDQLCERTNILIEELSSIMTLLELEGIVEELGGQVFTLTL